MRSADGVRSLFAISSVSGSELKLLSSDEVEMEAEIEFVVMVVFVVVSGSLAVGGGGGEGAERVEEAVGSAVEDDGMDGGSSSVFSEGEGRGVDLIFLSGCCCSILVFAPPPPPAPPPTPTLPVAETFESTLVNGMIFVGGGLLPSSLLLSSSSGKILSSPITLMAVSTKGSQSSLSFAARNGWARRSLTVGRSLGFGMSMSMMNSRAEGSRIRERTVGGILLVTFLKI